ncbi:MAG: MBOAT family protein, partial [Gammaproteobacteria bacterium]
MLFNSYFFIFIFMPITLVGYRWLCVKGWYESALGWLVACSLFFYGWWNPAYLGLILLSIGFNYGLGSLLGHRHAKWLLAIGVIANLALLGYFKYANFFVDTMNWATGNTYHLEKIILPLAISFFTFQQISYLVDTYRGETQEYNFIHYCLFVTFFPQLIAGPIVHHAEMLPQFMAKPRADRRDFAVGLTIFAVGLFKKTVLADGIAVYSSPVYHA